MLTRKRRRTNLDVYLDRIERTPEDLVEQRQFYIKLENFFRKKWYITYCFQLLIGDFE